MPIFFSRNTQSISFFRSCLRSLPFFVSPCARKRRVIFNSATVFTVLTMLASAFIVVGPVAAKSKRRVPAGGRVAVVVDERLSALRDEPGLSGPLTRRLGRGRAVAMTGARRAADGVAFYQVVVTRRTRGWLQSESFAAPSRAGDDARLLNLIRSSRGFDRVERARLCLDLFPRSSLRSEVLLLYGEAAEESAVMLSRAASNRLEEDRLPTDAAPLRSYYLNFNGLDRFRKQGVEFTFDAAMKQFHYDGASWREILRRYPQSREASQARKYLDALRQATAR
ncbi:MAG: hypothetical protein QOE33_1059 [Acidobacteriota bacterium]|nr:hypothetical protein [Acidobacteriota bacterium]